jgi:hypothetical protein
MVNGLRVLILPHTWKSGGGESETERDHQAVQRETEVIARER